MYSPHFYNGVIESEESVRPDEVNERDNGPLPAAVRLCLLALQSTVIRGWLTAGEVSKLVKMHPYNAAIILSKCIEAGCVICGHGPAGKYYKLSDHGVRWLRKMFADAHTTVSMFERIGMFRAAVSYDSKGHVHHIHRVTAYNPDTAVSLSTVAADMLACCNHSAMLSETVTRLLYDLLHDLPSNYEVSDLFELVGRGAFLTSPWRTMFIDNELDCYTFSRWLSYHLFHSINPSPVVYEPGISYVVWPQWTQRVTPVMVNKLPSRLGINI